MKLQTKISLQPEQHQIDYQSKTLLLGSCFVENIGNKFEYFKFQSLKNPLGILFNPVVIDRLISNAIGEKTYSDVDVFFHKERWHCFDAHSGLSAVSKEELLERLNTAVRLTNKQIHDATHVIITLGTAWVYRHIETNNIVANCHKVPQKQFNKELLSIETITDSLDSMVSNIRKANPKAAIIFTISPVRHLKDGFIQNQQSKAHLISAIHNLKTLLTESKNWYYFPSYEIMMDELRDYRFYAEDMIHPNQTAINYIWEVFKASWIVKQNWPIMDEVANVQKGLSHTFFNPKSDDSALFIKNLEAKKAMLEASYPYMKF